MGHPNLPIDEARWNLFSDGVMKGQDYANALVVHGGELVMERSAQERGIVLLAFGFYEIARVNNGQ
jgi:hypothetical protein